MQEEMLLEVLQQERPRGEEGEGSESWEEALADAFVIDSGGHFSKIGSGTLRTREASMKLLKKRGVPDPGKASSIC